MDILWFDIALFVHLLKLLLNLLQKRKEGRLKSILKYIFMTSIYFRYYKFNIYEKDSNPFSYQNIISKLFSNQPMKSLILEPGEIKR